MSLLSIKGAIELGLIFAIMSLGVYITFRIQDIPDLTVDGSFVTGAAISALYAFSGKPLLGIFVSIIGGALAGLATALLHTKLKITALLSGILAQLGLYSINLRIMGKPNIPLMSKKTIFNTIDNIANNLVAGLPKGAGRVIFMFARSFFLLIVVAIVVIALYWFLKTRMGTSLRATGNNIAMVRALGINSDLMTIIGLVLSNALIAFSGGIYAQQQGFADANMGIGMIVTGLASVIIGEVLFSRGGLLMTIIAVSLGAVLFRFIIAFALELGMPSTDLRLISSVIVAICLSAPIIQKIIKAKIRERKADAHNA
ncbi:MAG: ABC transporter permease [Bacillota bacterium]|nr:ABC transporter permease [Bacillota bacterium]